MPARLDYACSDLTCDGQLGEPEHQIFLQQARRPNHDVLGQSENVGRDGAHGNGLEF